MAATNIQTFAGQVEVTSNLTVDTNTLHVDSVAGRVGIGKTNPAFAMDVDGTLNATSLYVGGSELQGSPWTETANSNIYYTSNVGIGTTNPLGRLHVSGDLILSNVDDSSTTCQLIVESPPPSLDYEAYGTLYGYLGGNTANYYFGEGGDISGDGNWLTTTEKGYNNSTGQVRFYVTSNKANGSWSFAGSIYGSDNYSREGYFGEMVRLSPTGDEAYVAQTFDSGFGDAPPGHVYTFTRSGNSFSSTPTQKLTGGAPAGRYGQSMELSKDGTTLAVQAWADQQDGYIGKTYIYRKVNGLWQQQYVNAPGYHTFEGQGSYSNPMVCLSSDASVIAIGEYRRGYPTNNGRVKILTRSGNTWVVNTNIDPTNSDSQLGRAISMNVDGTKIVAGTLNNNVYIIEKSGSNWVTSEIFDVTSISGVSSVHSRGIQLLPDGLSIHLPLAQSNSSSTSSYIVKKTGSTWSLIGNIVSSENISSSIYKQIRFQNDGQYGVRYIPWSGDGGTTSNSGALQQIKSLSFGAGFDPYLVSDRDIKVNGTVLSFTGQHRCSTRGYVEEGMVVSASENKYVSLNGDLRTGSGAINISESLPVVSLSNVVNDSRVFGVVDSVERHTINRKSKINNIVVEVQKEKGDDKAIINSIGEGALWVINTNGSLKSGDYLTTSNITGYAQKQDDDILHSYTVGKITMDCDFNPKSVPRQIIKKDEHGENVLDTFGKIIWEDTDDMTKEYRLRYLDIDEKYTDESNAVYTAAFVGCTYHCG
jgi:hypothetical protein